MNPTLPPPHRFLLRTILALGLLLLASCGSPFGTPTPTTQDPLLATPTFDSTATPLPTSTPGPIPVWLSPALPEALRQPLAALTQVAGRPVQIVSDRNAAVVRAEADATTPLATWVYAAVAPFPTVQDSIDIAGLHSAWVGDGAPGQILYVSATTAEAMNGLLGPRSEAATSIAAEGEIVDRAWQSRPSLAIVPFESLEPRWKVLSVDGISPLQKTFAPESYGLTVHFGLTGDPVDVADVEQAIAWPATNRDASKMTVVLMTGTTALTRATAWKMEMNGVDYPGLKIGDWLREADITHVSNEVAFTPKCPRPDPTQDSLVFCSPAEDIGLLDQIGVRLVELTGNHILDWGQAALNYTLDQYRQRGWQTFGGGADLAASMKPATFEHNGNKIAFLGCNPAGPPEDWATATSPGSTPCDYDTLFSEVAKLKGEGYLIIFTFQWSEYYRSSPPPVQVAGFRRAVDAGAAIVSGSQSHEPMGFEFYSGSFIHYGPGNLFFDQMFSTETRQEFLDRYVIYEGRHISTELLTAYLEDYAQPRPMTLEERGAFLARMFTASGW